MRKRKEDSPRSIPADGGGQVSAPAEAKSHNLRLEGPAPEGSVSVRVLWEKERILRLASWVREGGTGPERRKTRKRSDAFVRELRRGEGLTSESVGREV